MKNFIFLCSVIVKYKPHTNFTIIRLFHIKEKLIWLFVKRVKA